MPQRVRQAPHLGVVLQDEPRRDIAGHAHLHDAIDEWRNDAREERRAGSNAAGPSKAADGAGQPLLLNEFQAEFARLAGVLRKKGLPAGQP
jgi:hypothetical protein